MKVVIGSARIDEHGNISGGADGDNNGKEVMTELFYQHSLGWYCLRPKWGNLQLAKTMLTACANDYIGYNQNKRTRIYSTGIHTSTPTVCDCASLAVECIREALGIEFPNSTTYNLATNCEKVVRLRSVSRLQTSLSLRWVIFWSLRARDIQL